METSGSQIIFYDHEEDYSELDNVNQSSQIFRELAESQGRTESLV